MGVTGVSTHGCSFNGGIIIVSIHFGVCFYINKYELCYFLVWPSFLLGNISFSCLIACATTVKTMALNLAA